MKRLGWFVLSVICGFSIWRIFLLDSMLENLPRTGWIIVDCVILGIISFLLLATGFVAFIETFFEKNKPTK